MVFEKNWAPGVDFFMAITLRSLRNGLKVQNMGSVKIAILGKIFALLFVGLKVRNTEEKILNVLLDFTTVPGPLR